MFCLVMLECVDFGAGSLQLAVTADSSSWQSCALMVYGSLLNIQTTFILDKCDKWTIILFQKKNRLKNLQKAQYCHGIHVHNNVCKHPTRTVLHLKIIAKRLYLLHQNFNRLKFYIHKIQFTSLIFHLIKIRQL